MLKKYVVSLSESERHSLEQIFTTGKRAAYTINHARILLKADRNAPDGSWRDTDIKQALDLSVRTIERVRQRMDVAPAGSTDGRVGVCRTPQP